MARGKCSDKALMGLCFALSFGSVGASWAGVLRERPLEVASLGSPIDRDGARCDRTIEFSQLSAEEQAKLRRDEFVTRFVRQSGGFEVGYVFKLSSFDPELIMGMYTSANEHAGANGLGDFIKTSYIRGSGPEKPANPYQVVIEQTVDWPYSNSWYAMDNRVTRSGSGFLLEATLVESSSASFSPRWADGYFRVSPDARGGSFVVGCNYQVPRTDSWQGKFVDTSRERVLKTGQNLLRWIDRVARDSSRAKGYRDRLAGILSGQRD